MEAFLSKASKTCAYGAILTLGIGLGVGLTSQSGFHDHYGLVCLAAAAFLAGGYAAYSTVRNKLHQNSQENS